MMRSAEGWWPESWKLPILWSLLLADDADAVDAKDGGVPSINWLASAAPTWLLMAKMPLFSVAN